MYGDSQQPMTTLARIRLTTQLMQRVQFYTGSHACAEGLHILSNLDTNGAEECSVRCVVSGAEMHARVVHTSMEKGALFSTLRSLLFKGTNFCVFCDLEKFAKFKDRKIYAACASGAALYSMRTLRAQMVQTPSHLSCVCVC